MTRRECLALAVTPHLAAQSRQEQGKQILRECLDKLGGDRYLKMRDRVETGRVYSFYREQLAGLARATIYTRYVTAPESSSSNRVYLRERQAFGKDEDYAVLFDEEKGWQITFRGARPIPQATIDRFHESTRRNFLYILRQRMHEKGLLFESKGAEVFENQPVDVVEITDTDNVPITVLIHKSTKLPVRQMFFRRDPATRERNEEITYFSKFRDVGDGVQWPFAMSRLRNGEKIFEIFSDSVSINRDLADQLFTLPANMKVLPPAR